MMAKQIVKIEGLRELKTALRELPDATAKNVVLWGPVIFKPRLLDKYWFTIHMTSIRMVIGWWKGG